MNPKHILYIVLALIVATIGGCIYLNGRGDATRGADLRTARTVIKTERETAKIESTTTTRVDAESIATTRTAEAADDEIQRIRERARPVPVAPPAAAAGREPAGVRDSTRPDASDRAAVGDSAGDADAARVLQLAVEARAAALAAGAKLQPARPGTR